MYHNIEKSKNHDHYVGYGLGNVWRIRRHYYGWVAYPQLPDDRGIIPNTITRKLLRGISQALSSSHPGGGGGETMIVINIYREGGRWFGARWIGGEYDGCDELDVEDGAPEEVALAEARDMPLLVLGERQINRVADCGAE